MTILSDDPVSPGRPELSPPAVVLAVGFAYTLGALSLLIGLINLTSPEQFFVLFLSTTAWGAILLAGAELLRRRRARWPLWLGYAGVAGVWIALQSAVGPDPWSDPFLFIVGAIVAVALAGLVASLRPSIREWMGRAAHDAS